MRFIAILIFTFITNVFFAQEFTKLDYSFDPEFKDRMNIRHFSDGSFVVLAEKRKKLKGVYSATLFDASGNKINEFDHNQCLSAFCTSPDNSYGETKYSKAMNQVNEAFMFDSQNKQMLRFECRKAIFKVVKMTLDGKKKKYEHIDMVIPSGAGLTDWKVYKLGTSKFRSLMVYNGLDKMKIKIVQIDFDTKNDTFELKSKDILSPNSSEWIRPEINFIQDIGNKKLYAFSFGEVVQFITIDEDFKYSFLSYEIPLKQSYQIQSIEWIQSPDGGDGIIVFDIFDLIDLSFVSTIDGGMALRKLVRPKYVILKAELEEEQINIESELLEINFSPEMTCELGTMSQAKYDGQYHPELLYLHEFDDAFRSLGNGKFLIKRERNMNFVSINLDKFEVESSISNDFPRCLNISENAIHSSDKFDLIDNVKKYVPESTDLFWIYHFDSEAGERLVTLDRERNEILVYD